jgi:hypothetical protein
VTETLDGGSIAARLQRLVDAARDAGLRPSPLIFASTLAAEHPEICAEAATWILEQPPSPIDGCLAAFLAGTRSVDADAAGALAARLVDQSTERRASLASYLADSGPLSAPTDLERELFSRVFDDDDAGVRSLAAIGLMRLASWVDDPERIKAALLAFEPRDDSESAEHLAAAITTFGVDRFAADELDALLARFADVSHLEYHAQKLLEQVGQSRASASIDLLIARLTSASENDLSILRFTAIPDRQLQSSVLDGASTPLEYRDLVVRLRDASTQVSGSASFALSNGIWDVVGEPWVALDVFSEWLASDRGEEREAALAVLGDMPWPLLLDLAFPIAVLVEELTATSLETATDLASVLRSAAQTGSISNARYGRLRRSLWRSPSA